MSWHARVYLMVVSDWPHSVVTAFACVRDARNSCWLSMWSPGHIGSPALT